jgi:tetratricopeptide (TPR) repeat protein
MFCTGVAGDTRHASTSGRRDPDMRSAEKHHNRGYSLRKQGRFDEAIAEYTMAIAKQPGYFKALFARGFAYDKVRFVAH